MADIPSSKTPLWAGIGIGLVLISGAVAWRIVTSKGDLTASLDEGGIRVEIARARDNLEDARKLLDELQQELEHKDADLRKAERELREREAKIQELLAELEATPHAGAPSPAVANLRTELNRLRTPLDTTSVSPVDRQKLELANEKLKHAATAIQALEATPR